MANDKKAPLNPRGKAWGTVASTMASWRLKSYGGRKSGSGKPRGKAKLKLLHPPVGGWPANTEPYSR